MAQTTCPRCGGELDAQAAACPACGALAGASAAPAEWWRTFDWPLAVGVALCVGGFGLSALGQRAGQALEAVGVVVIGVGWAVSRRSRT